MANLGMNTKSPMFGRKKKNTLEMNLPIVLPGLLEASLPIPAKSGPFIPGRRSRRQSTEQGPINMKSPNKDGSTLDQYLDDKNLNRPRVCKN